MFASDMLQQFREPQIVMQQQQPLASPMGMVWGTDAPPPLRFGGREILPSDPMYLLIQKLILQRYGGGQQVGPSNQ